MQRMLPDSGEPDDGTQRCPASGHELDAPEEREQAVCLRESLDIANEMVRAGERDARAIAEAMREHIMTKPLARIDYISIADCDTLEELDTIDTEAVVLLAVFFSKARLIDNEILKTN